ncbi:hypothetical protein [Microcella sp.]|uniref:hypothetical protein n=1 Tax=Microcella sp. TaxID=1913979 RepID=UPI00391B772B
MNMFKSMIDTINATPALIESANTLAAQAQTQAAMNPVAFGAAGMPGTVGSQAAVNIANQQAHGAPSAEALEPIAGVSLETYAKVSKGIAAYGYDTTKLVDVAAGLGVSAVDWAVAQEGWGARIQADRAVGSRFNELYTAL